MNLFVMVPGALDYVRYMTSFCKEGAEEALASSRESVKADCAEDTGKQDEVIRDLLRMALDRRLGGAEFETVFSALESEFELCGLDSRAGFTGMSWFFEFYIKERQKEFVGDTEAAKELLTQFYEKLCELPEGPYKANMCLYFLHNALNLQVVGQLSEEVDAVLAILDGYELEDEAVQAELAGVFQLMPLVGA